ncbi:hypothetical protein pb186bvf_002926 [Paramecium bursaria]
MKSMPKHMIIFNLKQSVLIPLTPRSAKSQTSRRRSSNVAPKSFEAVANSVQITQSAKQLKGLQLRDPQQIDEFLRTRPQQPKMKELKQSIADKKNQEIYQAKDVLTKALQEKDEEAFLKYKSLIQDSADPHKNFFEFNTYFYKNYQANNNGPCTVLPQKIINKVELFQEKLQRIIDEQ